METPPLGPDPTTLLAAVRDLLFVLAPATTILQVSPNCTALTGFGPELLVGRPLASLVHGDDAPVFVAELRDAAAHAGHRFRFHARIASAFAPSRYTAFDLHGRFQFTQPSSRLIGPPGFFSLTARPAFLEKSVLLDSFLGLKIEQEALLRQVQELHDGNDDSSEGEDEDGGDSISPLSITASVRIPGHHRCLRCLSSGVPALKSEDSSPSDFRLCRCILYGLSSDCLPAAAPKDHPGLYRSPTMATGDEGISFIVKPAPKRKKRPQKPTEYICTWCNATSAPEWRRGPDGPKTLCNACGLRYSKSRRLANSTAGGPGDPSGSVPAESGVGGAMVLTATPVTRI